eukprot:3635975-Pyramimonas_sp.AAC.1
MQWPTMLDFEAPGSCCALEAIEFHIDLNILVDVTTMEHLPKRPANVNCEPDENMMCHETLVELE